MLSRLLDPFHDPLCHSTLSRASRAIHQHHWRLPHCKVVQGVVEPFERSIHKRVRARFKNELKRAILDGQKLAEATQFNA